MCYCLECPAIPGRVEEILPVCRDQIKLRTQRRKFKPSVPRIIIGNVRSVVSKMDGLGALIKTHRNTESVVFSAL